jgi:hypothetical protein
MSSNEPVGKVLLTSEKGVFGGLLTLPKHEIVDCTAFYEVILFCISPKNLLGDFSYSLNDSYNLRGQSPIAKPDAANPRQVDTIDTI